MNINDIRKIYFVGIGGIGMSALARYFKLKGIEVYGYDKTKTALTRKLEAEGMIIHYKEDCSQIPDGIDLVVFTPAVPETHLELVHFRAQNFPVKKRAEVLGMISQTAKTIAVAGTHGKTSTSSILSWILTSAGLGCSAFLGGIARNFESNFVPGIGDWVIVEADEYDRSFLHLEPDLAIILSMDADHLDIYGTADAVTKSFQDFTDCVKPNGKIFIKNGLTVDHGQLQSFGITDGDFRAKNLRVKDGFMCFDVKYPNGEIKDIKFSMPGLHNVSNAVSAIAIALELGLENEAIKSALSSFKGIQRRFEWVCRTPNVYIDDYAHHPTELDAAIGAAKMLFPSKKITGVFQPHLFSRTRDFVEGFAKALDQLDELYLLDIYPARELPIPGVTAEMILKKMNLKNKRLTSKKEFLKTIEAKRPEVLLSLGAGDIGAMVNDIKKIMTHE